MADPRSRLAQFRSEWVNRVTWHEVRAYKPRAFRDFLIGLLILVGALGLAVLCTSATFGWPFALRLPSGLGLLEALILVVLPLATIFGAIVASVALVQPFEARRAVPLQRFAEQRGLMFSRFGPGIDPGGLFLVEAQASKRPKKEVHGATHNLFRAEWAIWQPMGWREVASPLQIAVAGYTGGKHDPAAPRSRFRYLSMALPRFMPHLVIDSRRNGRLGHLLAGAQRLSLEGDFDRHFTVYAPEGYERDALEILTPDVMTGLIDYGSGWDVEIYGRRLLVVSNRFRQASDRTEITALLLFAESVAETIARQTTTYSDPRAEQPRAEVAEPGRKLRTGWKTVVPGLILFAAIVVWCLASFAT